MRMSVIRRPAFDSESVVEVGIPGHHADGYRCVHGWAAGPGFLNCLRHRPVSPSHGVSTNMRIHRLVRLSCAALALIAFTAPAAELKPYNSAGCSVLDTFFAEEVWAKVAAESCLKCHKPGGDAEDSKLVLRDLARVSGTERTAALRTNRDAFVQMARVNETNSVRLLLKATGQVKHGGKEAVKKNSAEQKILADFVRLVNAPATAAARSSTCTRR